MLPRLSPIKGVPGDPRGLQCTWFSLSPNPLSWRKLKKVLKLPSHRYLPTPNISFSPPSLHFCPELSLLLIMYLPSLRLKPCSGPPWQGNVKKNIYKKGRDMGKFRACLYLVLSPLWNIVFPVNCILQYFSLGCRAWHLNLGLIVEK